MTEGDISAQAESSLKEITVKTLDSSLHLTVRDDQKKYMASNAVSVAQAHFSKYAWFRAVYADKTPVGFVMLYDNSEKPEYFLWRFMIDAKFQGKGFGKRALELLINYVKSRPKAKELILSYVPGKESPEKFYLKMGFENTGKVIKGEQVMRLNLDPKQYPE